MRVQAFLASLAIGGSAFASTIYPANNGFEVNNLAGGYEYGTVPSWTVTGGAGEAANGSAFRVTGATNGNSDGTTSDNGQAAFFQGGDGTLAGVAITQDITAAAGTLSINYAAEERDCCSGNNNQAIAVYLDGNLLQIATPATGSFTNYSTSPVTVSAGTHTIGFAGLRPSTNTGDTTVFLDNVSVTNVVPEPASLGILGLGAVGLLARRRRA